MAGYGLGYGLFWASLLWFFIVLGFSYIVWILANKESGWVKTTGIVIGCGIALLALITLIYGAAGVRKYGRYGMGGIMTRPGSKFEMKMEGREGREMMKKMMEEMMKEKK